MPNVRCGRAARPGLAFLCALPRAEADLTNGRLTLSRTGVRARASQRAAILVPVKFDLGQNDEVANNGRRFRKYSGRGRNVMNVMTDKVDLRHQAFSEDG